MFKSSRSSGPRESQICTVVQPYMYGCTTVQKSPTSHHVSQYTSTVVLDLMYGCSRFMYNRTSNLLQPYIKFTTTVVHQIYYTRTTKLLQPYIKFTATVHKSIYYNRTRSTTTVHQPLSDVVLRCLYDCISNLLQP